MRPFVTGVTIIQLEYRDSETRVRDWSQFVCGPGALRSAVAVILGMNLVEENKRTRLLEAIPGGLRQIERVLYGDAEEYPEFGVFVTEHVVSYIE